MLPCSKLWQAFHIDGLVQERCNSIANALELCLPCTNPSILCSHCHCQGKMIPTVKSVLGAIFVIVKILSTLSIGLVLNRWKVIAWTHDDPVDCHIYDSIGFWEEFFSYRLYMIHVSVLSSPFISFAVTVIVTVTSDHWQLECLFSSLFGKQETNHQSLVSHSGPLWAVWYKTKFGSHFFATNRGDLLCISYQN